MIAATVCGNLGRDAELRDTRAGSVLSFSVASSQGKRGEETTTWVRCSLFGKRAEALAQYLTKGTRVAVAGSMSLREYEGRNGPGTSLELLVSEVQLMGGGERASGARSGAEASEDDTATAEDDDIPF